MGSFLQELAVKTNIVNSNIKLNRFTPKGLNCNLIKKNKLKELNVKDINLLTCLLSVVCNFGWLCLQRAQPQLIEDSNSDLQCIRLSAEYYHSYALSHQLLHPRLSYGIQKSYIR